ncbi:DNA damage-regulated autophagy modulator protein 2-like [Euwallacea similis]|uniref:DNA damage-regulated autophagy modulator protein 2-like n=1 Tax=Euwallacea similis TaxID=1736056 RepID=UPI00344B6D34
MAFKYCYLLPIVQGLLYPVTFIATYALSVANGHVPAILPYVSDTGAWSLERSIFSFMLGFGAVLMLLTFYIRYRQVKDILDRKNGEKLQARLSSIHRVSFYCTFLSVVGVFTLGCFQVQPFFVTHIIGAFTAFGFGWFVLVIQTYISFKIYPSLGSKRLNTLRAVVLGIITTALILTLVFGVMAFAYFRGDDITKWTEDSGGYYYHLISTGSEWFLIFGVVFYLSLYAIEFKPIVIFKPKIKLTDEE